MIITRLLGGLGNQLFQYAVARRLAHKLNVELKIDKFQFNNYKLRNYQLDDFNIKENFATVDDINYVINKSNPQVTHYGMERNIATEGFLPEVLNYPDNIYFVGDWQCEKYFSDIEPIIRHEFTLKPELMEEVSNWANKIHSAECPVSLHIRHGDYAFDPKFRHLFGILPLNYYRDCVETLKKSFNNITLFVFSDDMEWVKSNLKLDVAMEFVENVPRDSEEIYLMSLCKHNIIANSSFSWWGAWLNNNPNKQVFVPDPWFRMSVGHKDIVPSHWTKIPVDFNQEPDLKTKPIFSIIIVANENEHNLSKCLENILSQSFKSYEIILICDDKVNDFARICGYVNNRRNNINLIKLNQEINKYAAWNIGIKFAKGDYILMLTGNDLILSNTLHTMYFANERTKADVLHSYGYFVEDEAGNVSIINKKFNVNIDEPFKDLKSNARLNIADDKKLNFWADNKINKLLSTKIFKRNFLIDNKIHFKHTLNDNAGNLFLIECLFHSSNYFLVPQAFYISPNKSE
ncbi:MAG: alpha-1,2-fucosyltransferase [Selenomonadaceae bacterium]|nr:alpha-1,2-fucosyltransferase [Selenomonadaceae bacterium]